MKDYRAKRGKQYSARYYNGTEQARVGTSPLWDDLYMVRIPNLQLQSNDELRRFGYRTSGVDVIDRYIHMQETTCEININAMFEYYRKNITISVVRHEDSKKIYEAIQDHLKAWANGASEGIHTDPEILKDLVELDNFANKVYEHAKHYFPRNAVDMDIPEVLRGIQDLTRKNILLRRVGDPEPVNVRNPGVDDGKRPERSELKNYFEEQLNQVGGWRGLKNG